MFSCTLQLSECNKAQMPWKDVPSSWSKTWEGITGSSWSALARHLGISTVIREQLSPTRLTWDWNTEFPDVHQCILYAYMYNVHTYMHTHRPKGRRRHRCIQKYLHIIHIYAVCIHTYIHPCTYKQYTRMRIHVDVSFDFFQPTGLLNIYLHLNLE